MSAERIGDTPGMGAQDGGAKGSISATGGGASTSTKGTSPGVGTCVETVGATSSTACGVVRFCPSIRLMVESSIGRPYSRVMASFGNEMPHYSRI